MEIFSCPRSSCKRMAYVLTRSRDDEDESWGYVVQVRCPTCGLMGPMAKDEKTAIRFWNELPREHAEQESVWTVYDKEIHCRVEIKTGELTHKCAPVVTTDKWVAWRNEDARSVTPESAFVRRYFYTLEAAKEACEEDAWGEKQTKRYLGELW